MTDSGDSTSTGGDIDTTNKLSSAQMQSREDELHDGLDSLSSAVMRALSLEQLLQHVADTASAAIPGVDAVAVTLVRGDVRGRTPTYAASDPTVSEIEVIQHETLHEGPCVTAEQERQPIRSDSLATDRRWPRFGPRASAIGLNSALSLPMLLPDGSVVGTLNCYGRLENVFDEHATTLGMLFAAPAAAAVHNSQLLAQAQEQAAQLQTALVTRAIIDQAIGIVRSRSGGTSEEGFATLREISQRENVKLSVVAERLVEEAVRRARARRLRG